MSGRNVFVYGTLMYPEVLNALVNRVPSHAPAMLHAHVRHSIHNRKYPGCVPSSSDAQVGGAPVANAYTHILTSFVFLMCPANRTRVSKSI